MLVQVSPEEQEAWLSTAFGVQVAIPTALQNTSSQMGIAFSKVMVEMVALSKELGPEQIPPGVEARGLYSGQPTLAISD